MKKFFLFAAAVLAALTINAQKVVVLNEVANYIDFQALTTSFPEMTSVIVTSTNTCELPNGTLLVGHQKEDGSEAENKWNVKESYNTTMPTPSWDGVDSLKVGTMFRAASGTTIELGAFTTTAAGNLTVYYQPNGDGERGVEVYVYGEKVEGTNLTGDGTKINGIRPGFAGFIALPAGSYDAGDVVIKLVTNTSNIFGVAIEKIAGEPEVERELTKLGINFPTENCPADNSIEMAGSFKEGTMAMEKINTGWFLSYDFVNAAADDTFKFRDKANKDMVLCKFIPANGEAEGKWVQAVIKFGNYWNADTWKGTPCKLIELDLSDAAQYAWKQGMPEPDPDDDSAVENVNADVKSVKTIENGQLVIIKNGVKYNALGTEIR